MALYTDLFAGGSGADLLSHIADTGQTWGGSLGFFELDGSGQVWFNGGTTVTFQPFNWTPASADYDVTVTFNQLTNTTGQIGVYGRGVDQLNCYFLQTSGGGTVVLRRYIAGVSTAIPGATGTLTTPAGPITLRFRGTTISVLNNGSTAISGTDSTFTAAGTAGLYGWTTTGAAIGMHAGAFTVSDVSGTTLTCPAPTLLLNEGTTVQLHAPISGGTSPISYQWQQAPDVSGSAGTYVNSGSPITPSTNATFSGLATNTKFWWRYIATDSSGTPQVVTSSGFSLTTFAQLPAFQATFTNWANGTPLVGGLYATETADIFSVQLSGTSGANGLVTSNGLTGVKTGNQFVATTRTLGMNAPLDAYFAVLSGTTTSAVISVGTRFNPSDGSGILATFTFSGGANTAKLGIEGTGGSFTQPGTAGSQTIAPTVTTGTYRVRFHPEGCVVKAFLQRMSDSNWWNGSSWQSSQVVLMSFALQDSTYLRTGSPYFTISAASTNIALVELISTQTNPAVGVLEVDANWVKLVLRSDQGGTGAVTRDLQQGLSGVYTSIPCPAAAKFDQYWYVPALVASTAYSWKLVSTDSTGIVTTSAVVSATTLATPTNPTVTAPHTPGSPITQWVSNSLQADTQGNPLQLHASGWLNGNGWDEATGLYWAVGQSFATGQLDKLILYSSPDMMNWENRGVVLSAAVNGYSSSLVPRLPKLYRHPTSGSYFIICNLVSPLAPNTATLAIFSNTSLQGSYATNVYNAQPSSVHVFDIAPLLDDDQSMNVVIEVVATGATIATLSGDWSTVSTTSVVLPLFNSAPSNRAIDCWFRRGNLYYMLCPTETNWTTGSGITGAYVATQAFVSGSKYGPYCQVPGPFTSSDSTYTVATSLHTQPTNFFLNRANEWVYVGDDYNIGSAFSASSGNTVIPATFDSGGTPTIPYALNYTPAATPPSRMTISGPATLFVGTPGTYTATLDYPAPTGGVSIVPSVSGFAATFGTNPVVIAAGATSGTFAVTSSTTASGTVGGSSAGLLVFAESVTSTATAATGFTISGPSVASVGNATTSYTVTPAGGVLAAAKTVVVKDDLNITVATLNFAMGASAGQTFTFTPTTGQVGPRTLTPTASPALGTPPTCSTTVYLLTLSPSTRAVFDGVAASLTAVLTGGSGSINANSTTGGTLSTANPTTGVVFTVTPPGSGSGSLTITVSGPGGSSATATVTYSPSAASAFTLSMPATGAANVTSGTCTVTPNGPLSASEVVVVKDDLNNIATTLSFAAAATAGQTFTFRPAVGQAGSRTFTATATPTLGSAPTAAMTIYSLSLTPATSSVANNVAVSLTATLVGGSGSLTAATGTGTLSTTTPTSGTPFTLTTPTSGAGSITVTVSGPGGSVVTATINYAASAGGSVTPAQQAAQGPCYVVTDGVTTPATADNWYPAGLYQRMPYYQSISLGLFLWSNDLLDPTGRIWTISTALGVPGSASFATAPNSDLDGLYVAAGTATGTPTVYVIGNNVLSGFQPALYGIMASVTANGFKLDPRDKRIGAQLANWTVVIDSATTGAGQVVPISSSDPSGNCTIAGWQTVQPTGLVKYHLQEPVGDNAGYLLGPTGLDSVPGFDSYTFTQTVQLLGAAILGERTGMPVLNPPGLAGTLTMKGKASGKLYGTISWDTNGNQTTSLILPS